MRAKTLFLRLALIGMGAIAILLAIAIVPGITKGMSAEYPAIIPWRFPIIILLEAAVIPFCIALAQSWKLLSAIDVNAAFSETSIQALRNIRRSMVAIGILFTASLVPLFTIVIRATDAPGLGIIGMAIIGTPFVVAVFASLLAKLVHGVNGKS